MKIDFSNLNLQYLIHVRDIAREDPDVAAPLLGMSSELAALLAQVAQRIPDQDRRGQGTSHGRTG